MATQKSNIPALRFPEYKGEWKQDKLYNLSENGFSNGVFNAPDRVGRGYKLINVKDMYLGNYIDTDKLTLVDIDEKEFLKNRVKWGDVFFTRSSLVKEGIAHTNIILTNSDDVTYDGHLIKMSPRKEIIYPIFLALFAKTRKARKEFILRGKTTTMTTIGQEDIGTVPVIFPIIDEQKKIADFLTAVDQKIAQLTEKKSCLERYKKGVMQRLFTQRLRFHDTNGNPFPDWEEKKLDDVCVCLDNLRKPLNDSERQKMQGTYPYWGANNIMDYIDDYIFDETIILLAEDGGNFNEYKDRPIANLSNGKCWVNNHTHVLKGKDGFLNEFLFYSLVHKDITGYVSGGTRAKLTKGEMLKIPLVIPCLKEQQKIADFLTAIDAKITALGNQLTAAQDFKKSLLQKMFV